VQRVLDDGSFLSVIRPTGVGRAKAQEQAITVRVIEYALPGLDDAQPRYRLLTTLLDPQLAPAMELAALYHQRWEVEAYSMNSRRTCGRAAGCCAARHRNSCARSSSAGCWRTTR